MAFKRIEDDVQNLQNRVAILERGPRGSAALRDEMFGVPANAAERVALAGARWYDTTRGIWFKYYAYYSDPGVPPGCASAASGGDWYPDDIRMPAITLDLEASQSIPATTDTLVAWRSTAPAYDPFGMYDLATHRVTLPFSGLWRVSFKVRSAGGTAGIRASVRRNGSIYARANASNAGTTSIGTTVTTDVPVYASAGQYFEFFVYAISALAITQNETTVQITYMGPPPK